jgi:hypothetical protein
MFATLKNLIPEPRQAEHPRRYIGRHRQPDAIMDVEPETVDAAEPEATLEEPVAVGPDRQIA